MSEKIDLNYVVGAIERLKAWVEVEEQRANYMCGDGDTETERAMNVGKTEILEQVRVRIDTLIMVIEEVAKDE